MTKKQRMPYYYAAQASDAAKAVGSSNPPLNFTNVPKSYQPPPLCIYCAKRPGTTDEHIIPQMIGGKLILKDGSCTDCQQIVNLFETRCANLNFKFVRGHFGIFGRKDRHRNRIRGAVHLDGNPDKDPQMVAFEVDDHPGVMVTTTYAEGPQILTGGNGADIDHNTSIVFCHVDFAYRLQKIGLMQLGGSDPIEFGRQIAKIAFAFACAEVGLHNFEPNITDLILGKDKRHPVYWIGSSLITPEPIGQLHQLSIETDHPLDRQRRFLIVRLRLFAAIKTPVYTIVVGRRID